MSVCEHARVCVNESVYLTAVCLHMRASTDVLIRAMQVSTSMCDGI